MNILIGIMNLENNINLSLQKKFTTPYNSTLNEEISLSITGSGSKQNSEYKNMLNSLNFQFYFLIPPLQIFKKKNTFQGGIIVRFTVY